MTLTVKAVEAAKPRDKGYKLADGQGLYLFVTPAGGKSWRANHTVAGKQKTRTYGRWPEMTLSDARRAHGTARETKAVETKKVGTFKETAAAWLKKKLPELDNPKHQAQVQGTLERFVYPALGARAIDSIPRADLVAVVQEVQKGGRIETAHRVASRITAVFDYAQDTGKIDSHPASGLTRVLISRKVKKPMASIRPEETGELLRKIDGYSDPITRMGLLLLAHTFVRVGEMRGMAWNEFKEDGAVWVVPGERMKGKGEKRLPHVVPLSTQARALIATLRKMTGDGVLALDSPARPGHPVSENTFLFALYRLGYRNKMTAHGFRSLASTVLNEQSGFDEDVIERQLAHKESDAVRAAYNRAQYLTQRRALMQWWSDWLDAQYKCADPQPASE